jgi:hypothetical protein
MGYNITIGNAIPVHSTEYGYLYAAWEVEAEAHDSAPVFPNDVLTGNSNGRSPSYIAWSDSMRVLGLYELFYAKDGGLFANHPGCVMLTQNIADTIELAVARYRKVATKPAGSPGFPQFNKETQTWFTPDEDKYDTVLMRGEWLSYWVSWAVKNCKIPAIQNT